jgi:UDP-2,4-diacetamido-2,4,6-trideoxy-beta-L-altropyranose hydrolase
MYKILFRVEAYDKIALGHLTRCLSLAYAYRDLGCEVTFVIFNDKESIRRVKSAGFLYICRDYKIDNSNYLKDSIYIQSLNNYDILVVDSYQLDHDYFASIGESFKKVVYIDDLNNDYPVDIVVNSSCEALKSNYSAELKLLGVDFLILNKYYWNMPNLPNIEIVNSIMITMGGIDHYDYSSTLLPLIENIQNNIKVHIVVGPYYTNIDKINKAINISNLDVLLHVGLNNISEVIDKCDIGISGGGFTTYELVSASVPSIGIALWENQNLNIKCLAGHGAILPVYHGDNSVKVLEGHLRRLILNYDLRCSLSESGRSMLDGQGAKRIVAASLKEIDLK